MSNQEQLDRELREYLEKEPNLRREDRLIYLKTIYNKHFEFTKLEHVINNRDLFEIVSGAKQHFTKQSFPVSVSGKRVDSSDLPQLSMIESFTSYLQKMQLLKKFVKVDYTREK